MLKTSLARVAVTFSVLLIIVIGAFYAPNPTMGKVKQPAEVAPDGFTIADATLSARVNAKISQTPSLTDQNIKATAQNGVVTLTGNLNCSSKIEIAQNAAASVQGVKRVVNRVVNTRPGPTNFLCCCDGACWYQSERCPVC